MSEHIYRLQNVTRAYKGRRVLQVDHLQIRRGEVFALVGPSGAG
jgi:ABC-type multidrug transport system ATPase subunit